MGRALFNLLLAELHLDGPPATIVQDDDGVGLETRLIAIVVDGSPQLGRIHAQITHAQRFEKQPEGTKVQQELPRRRAQQGRPDARIAEVPRRAGAHGGLGAQRRIPRRQVLGNVGAPERVEVIGDRVLRRWLSSHIRCDGRLARLGGYVARIGAQNGPQPRRVALLVVHLVDVRVE